MKIILVFTLFFVTAFTAKLPFDTCHINKEDISTCLASAVDKAVQYLGNAGLPELGFPDLDPFHIDEVRVDQGNGPVSLNIRLLNFDVFGASNLKTTYIKLNYPEKQMLATLDTQNITVIGDYEMKGKVLLLPVNGKGKFTLFLLDATTDHDIQSEEIKKKNGKQYWLIKNYALTINGRKLITRFENLFNGNKELGENINNLLNENSDLLYNELQPVFSEALSQIGKELTRRIFSNVPIDEIFLKN